MRQLQESFQSLSNMETELLVGLILSDTLNIKASVPVGLLSPPLLSNPDSLSSSADVSLSPSSH